MEIGGVHHLAGLAAIVVIVGERDFAGLDFAGESPFDLFAELLVAVLGLQFESFPADEHTVARARARQLAADPPEVCLLPVGDGQPGCRDAQRVTRRGLPLLLVGLAWSGLARELANVRRVASCSLPRAISSIRCGCHGKDDCGSSLSLQRTCVAVAAVRVQGCVKLVHNHNAARKLRRCVARAVTALHGNCAVRVVDGLGLFLALAAAAAVALASLLLRRGRTTRQHDWPHAQRSVDMLDAHVLPEEIRAIINLVNVLEQQRPCPIGQAAALDAHLLVWRAGDRLV